MNALQKFHRKWWILDSEVKTHVSQPKYQGSRTESTEISIFLVKYTLVAGDSSGYSITATVEDQD